MKKNYFLSVFTVFYFVMSLIYATNKPLSVSEIAEKCKNAVCYISCQDSNGEIIGHGSGFICADCSVATNFHVIDGAHNVVIGFANGKVRLISNTVCNYDISNDLAILKMDQYSIIFPSLGLADSDLINLGDTVTVISTPRDLRLSNTISNGIVSGIREFTEGKRIQITAPISPGSSGGPVLNQFGEVIAITCSKIKGENLNFSIPVNYLKNILHTDRDIKLSQLSPTRISAPAPNALNPPHDTRPDLMQSIEGTYVGHWRSNKFDFSGLLVLKIISIGKDMYQGNATMTGGKIDKLTLDIEVEKTSSSTWLLNYVSKKPNVNGKAVISKGRFFEGDYRWRKFIWVDRGEWILQKE